MSRKRGLKHRTTICPGGDTGAIVANKFAPTGGASPFCWSFPHAAFVHLPARHQTYDVFHRRDDGAVIDQSRVPALGGETGARRLRVARDGFSAARRAGAV